MLKKEFFHKLTIILVYSLTCFAIYNNFEPTKKYKTENNKITKILASNKIIKNVEKPRFYIKINKINLYKPIYNIDSKLNNVEKNVTLLKETNTPNKQQSHIFIAAHSGPGDNAYFDKLDELKINDEIILSYNSIKYIYKIINIWNENKIGYISIKKENKNSIILTTCGKEKNKQLIIKATKQD